VKRGHRGLLASAAAIRSGQCSARELAEEAIARVEELDGELGAVCAACSEPDLTGELAAAARGPWGGVPVAVKDQLSVPWWTARDGASVASPPTPGEGSSVHSRLLGAGALPLLVTNMHQLGMGISGEVSAYGRTANPWDPDRWAGGSSGGSAVAVAAGYVPLAIGTDGGGSIRIPAAWCGVTGLKLTWDAVPTKGLTCRGSSMTAIGTIARDAADCRAGAEALTGRALAGDLPRRLRIGVLRGPEWSNVTGPAQRRFEDALELLEADGAELRPVQIEGAGLIPLATAVTLGLDRLGQATAEWLRDDFPKLDRSVRTLLKSRYRLPIDVVARVSRLRTLLRRESARLFATVDVIASPTVPAGAPKASSPKLELGGGEAVAPDLPTLQLTGLANLTGIPAITTPIGADEDGMPLGMTLQAPWRKEAVLLAAAERFERLSERRYLCPEYRPVAQPTREASPVP
jgi:Asp-tRNA(Asn)/Glu-tRNA(Gln) amidotransferase A subunit family amidase